MCGAANNQLADDRVDELLVEQGIVYVPDFVANAGGIINIAEEFTGYSRARALERTERIGDTVRHVLDLARTEGLAPGRAATRMARAPGRDGGCRAGAGRRAIRRRGPTGRRCARCARPPAPAG